MFLARKLKANKKVCRARVNTRLEPNLLANQLNVMEDLDCVVATPQLVDMMLPTQINKVIAQLGSNIYMLTDDGVYVYRRGKVSKVLDCNATEACYLAFMGKLYISGDKLGVYSIDDAGIVQKLSDINLDSMAVAGERIFAVKDVNVYHTLVEQVDDWQQTTTYTRHGECQAVVALGNIVYALGESCYRFVPSAEEIDFNVTPISHNTGTVERNSVAVFGQKAVFATANGLYQLQNNRLTPVFTQLNSVFDFSDCVGVVHCGTYYLSLKKKGSMARNTTLILDVEEQRVVGVMGRAFDSMYSNGTRLFLTGDGKLLSFSTNTSPSCWTVKCNFDSEKVKYLDSAVIQTKSDVTLRVTSEVGCRSFNVKGGEYLQMLPISGFGRSFTVEVSAQSDLNVSYLEFIAHTVEEAYYGRTHC